VVHVNKPRPCRRSKAWPHDVVSYLFATSPGELELMAKKLKLSKKHRRDHPTRPRYNLSPTMRVTAIAAGALDAPDRHN